MIFVIDLDEMERKAKLQKVEAKVKTGKYKWQYASDPKHPGKMTFRLVKK